MLRKFLVLLAAVGAVQWGTHSALAGEVSGPPMSVMERAEQDGEDAGRGPAAARAPAARSEGDEEADDEYNFSWLDPDKKVYVLQNRKFRKKGRLAIFASGGLNLSNPYRTEYLFTPRGSYWFSEALGIEVFYSSVQNSNNSNLTALRNASPTALPFVRENRNYFGAVLAWDPWYAKINFFNKILYFDWLVYAGAGQASTAFDQNRVAANPPNFKTEDLFTFYFGTAQQFYVTRNFIVRLDLLGMIYNATGADNLTKRNITNFDFTAGIGWAF